MMEMENANIETCDSHKNEEREKKENIRKMKIRRKEFFL